MELRGHPAAHKHHQQLVQQVEACSGPGRGRERGARLRGGGRVPAKLGGGGRNHKNMVAPPGWSGYSALARRLSGRRHRSAQRGVPMLRGPPVSAMFRSVCRKAQMIESITSLSCACTQREGRRCSDEPLRQTSWGTCSSWDMLAAEHGTARGCTTAQSKLVLPDSAKKMPDNLACLQM